LKPVHRTFDLLILSGMMLFAFQVPHLNWISVTLLSWFSVLFSNKKISCRRQTARRIFVQMQWRDWRNQRYYTPPLIGGGIKRCFCLTSDVCLSDVWLSRTSGLSRE